MSLHAVVPTSMPAVALARAPATSKDLFARSFDPAQTLQAFIPGVANDFCHKAVVEMAFGANTDLPLVFIHGDFGSGKTHLLNGAALQLRQRGKRVLYLRAEDFIRNFLGGVYRKNTFAFKQDLRAADALLVDDLQHLSNSAASATEFLFAVNALLDLHRCLMITSDRPLRELGTLGTSLRARLSSGIEFKLEAPDRATRLAIVKAHHEIFKAGHPGIHLEDDVFEWLVDFSKGPTNELIGMFTKLARHADITKRSISLEIAYETIGAHTPSAPKVTIEDVMRITSDYFNVTIADFQSTNRTRSIARPRQIAMYLGRQLTMRSLPEIGRRFGGRDHTTVLHAYRRIEFLCDEDPEFKQEVDLIRLMLIKA